ncbi:MAG: hypothetical protein ACP59X_23180 [Solidesulfovibrio sp. DCME]|uniref:hypothetical protein n=1 Tax=Solidesulfovibrio sp. DCME TaxID=3447380 RepID=UPI003D0C4CDC
MPNISDSYVVKRYGQFEAGSAFVDRLQQRVGDFRNAGLGDKDFESQLYGQSRDNFFSRLWELNLAEILQYSGCVISSRPIGPDFFTRIEDKNVWFEAVSPRPEGFPDEFDRQFSDDKIEVRDVPFRQILLRITSAIRDKAKKFEDYIKNGIVGASDVNIIAVDVTQLGDYGDVGVSQSPTIVEATYPVGPLVLKIEIKTGKVVEEGLSYRPVIEKNASDRTIQVPTETFLSGAYSHIGAAISGFGALQKTNFTLVHNVTATNKLPLGTLRMDKEYFPRVEEGMISLIDVQSKLPK